MTAYAKASPYGAVVMHGKGLRHEQDRHSPETADVLAFIWNLGTHEFRYDFTIFFVYMNSYMNS